MGMVHGHRRGHEYGYARGDVGWDAPAQAN